MILEICCSPSSNIGVIAEREFPDCKVVRITEEDDFTKLSGQNKVRNILGEYAGKIPLLVWVSFPCTGGSAWQNLNWRKGTEETRNHIRSHWVQLRIMWKALDDIVLPFLDGASTFMAFEWPAACSYWDWSSESHDLDGRRVPDIRGRLGHYLHSTALVHGCEHELRASCGPSKGELVRKLWRVDSDCESLTRALHRKKNLSVEQRRNHWKAYSCSHGKSVHHARCAGRVTRDTQHYPISLVRVNP